MVSNVSTVTWWMRLNQGYFHISTIVIFTYSWQKSQASNEAAVGSWWSKVLTPGGTMVWFTIHHDVLECAPYDFTQIKPR